MKTEISDTQRTLAALPHLPKLRLTQLHECPRILGMYGKARGVGHLDISRLPKADLVEEVERYVRCNIVNLTRQSPFCGMTSRAKRFADYVEGTL